MTRLWPEGEAIEIWGGIDAPTGFTWTGIPHRISKTYNHWRIHTRWWEPDGGIWREYVKVTTDRGLLCLLYRNLSSGEWFLARVYD